ncbi:hypothetical protein Hanom_Chr16g01502111 [Helianthus anomalus]
MYEHSTRAFNFPEGILAVGGLSLFYPTRSMAFFDGREMSLWSLLLADVRGVSYVLEGVINHEMGDVLGGEAPNAEGLHVEAVPWDGTPPLERASPKGSEGSQNSPQVEDISSGDEDLEIRLCRKRKPDLVEDITWTF